MASPVSHTKMLRTERLRSPHEISGGTNLPRRAGDADASFSRTRDPAGRPIQTGSATHGATAMGVRLGSVEPVDMKPVGGADADALFAKHEDYFDSRTRFLAYAQHLKALYPETKIGRVDVKTSDPNADLAISHVTIPAIGKAEKVIALSCGVHGPEAPYGAVGIEVFMRNELKNVDRTNTTVVFVHGVNPWGWVHNYRAGEDNVDRNRNTRAGEDVPSSAGFPAVQGTMSARTAPSDTKIGSYLYTVAGLAGSALSTMSIDKTTRGLAEGQSIDPRAPLYMGEGELPEIVTIREEVLRPAYRDAKRVFHGDFHTGLGKSGRLYYMGMSNRPDDEKASMASLADSRVIYQPLDEQLYDTSAVDYTKNSKDAAPEGCRVDIATLEVGGFDPDLLPFGLDGDSLLAQLRTAHRLRARGQLHFFPDSVSEERAAEIHALYKDLFNPDDEAWRKSAVEDTATLLADRVDAMNRDR